MIHLDIELTTRYAPRLLFLNKVHEYDDLAGQMVRGFMLRIVWLFVRLTWGAA